MLWKTHIRISKEVMYRLRVPLSSAEVSFLREGVVAPDKWRGRYESHHYGRSDEIKRHLMAARRLFLQNDLPNACYNLGIALHYIQDSFVSFPTSFSLPRHQQWEQEIEDSNSVDDLERTILYYLVNSEYQRNRCLHFAQVLSGKIQGRDNTLNVATLCGQQESRAWANPIVDLNLALKASLVVTESVLSSKNCPVLETQLKYLLSQHETFLRNAEIELSNRIISLIIERDQLKNKKVTPTGIVSKIENWITGVRIGIKDRALLSNYNNYVSRRHLENVANDYGIATNRTVAPYVDWYNCQVPQINISIVKRDLLPIQEIAGYFGFDEYSIKELLKKGNVLSFHIANNELIRRPELDRVLNQFPLNGFRKYPV